MSAPHKITQRTFKIIVLIAAYAFLAIRFYQFDDWHQLIEIFHKASPLHFFYLLAVLLLMPLNWSIEVVTWQYLLRPIKKISFLTSLKSVYSGLVAGIATPGKVGEWPGRALGFESSLTSKIILTSVFNSLIKTLSITFLGFLAWGFYALFDNNSLPFLNHPHFIIPAIGIGILIMLLFLFSRRVMVFVIGAFRKNKSVKEGLEWVTIKYRTWSFALSFSRALLFSLQFVLLSIFVLNDAFSINMLLIPPLYFFIITFIPAFSFADPGIRGSVAIILFTQLGQSSPVAAFIGILLWGINTVLPFVLGHWFLKTGDAETSKRV